MIRIAALSLLLLTGLSSAAQLFTQHPAALPQLSYSSCVWGDYDRDGDLDIALIGAQGVTPLSGIFRNDGGVFTANPSVLLPLHFGSAEWGDYDRDGDLDLLLTGMDAAGGSHTILYKNELGLFTEQAGTNLPGLTDGQATWGDLDNDGYPDILLSGVGLSRIYRNNHDGTFTDISVPLPALESPMCCWNDYNNDGQQDVLVAGNTGGGMIAWLYRNDHGTFTKVNVGPEPFYGLYGGQVRFADLDGDGDQDLAINGTDLFVDPYFLIYRNEGNDQFTKIDGLGAGLLNPWFDLGDYDGDGLTDIILIGTTPGCGGVAVTRLLKNYGDMNFSDLSTLLPGYKLGCASWGDVNNDGWNDLLFTGLDAFEADQTDIFLNNLGNLNFGLNTPPTVPDGLTCQMNATSATMRWNPASDGQTPSKALTYNLMIGTQPGTADVLSPMSDPATGLRSVCAPGNAGHDTAWILTGIPAGTYWFSVQAVDNGFMGSAFSASCQFTYSPTLGLREGDLNRLTLTPNPCHDRLEIRSLRENARLRICNASGACLFDGKNPGMLDVSGWPNGVYVVTLTSGSEQTVRKLIRY